MEKLWRSGFTIESIFFVIYCYGSYFRVMELFYAPETGTGNFFPDTDESYHLIRVMRHRIGDEVMVTDGRGKLARTKIANEDKKSCLLELVEIVKEEMQPSPSIHIAIAPTKNIDRFEWFLEKATEIGISEITPIICQRSERNRLKHERLHKILISAMKQSMRLWLPKLNETINFNDCIHLQSLRPDQKFICHCQTASLPLFQNMYELKKDVLILIGPEGDFNVEEINLAEERGFCSVSLGEARLRTETAGIVSLHTIQLLNS